jgi:hypothetical protein
MILVIISRGMRCIGIHTPSIRKIDHRFCTQDAVLADKLCFRINA